MNIAPFEQLEEEAKSIQNFLDITISEDPTEATQRGNDLAVYISRTGKMLADAKYHKDKRIKGTSMVKIKELGREIDIPASTLNELIKSSCYLENYLVNWIDRLNRTAVHQLDWCRTLISKAKEEMKLGAMIT